MDTSTLIVVFLLVTAASLASYALSHWGLIRGALNLSWAATSIGTTMLLVAAAIVVLTFVFRGPLWRPNLGAEQQMHERAVASEEISARQLESSLIPSGAAQTSALAGNHSARSPRNRHEADVSPAATAIEPEASKAATAPSHTRLSSTPPGAFRIDDPWGATRCVHVYHPGSDPTEWKIDNDCDLPVGVHVTGCDKGAGPCGSMVLPSKGQRPIPLEEQIVYGHNVRHVACFAATASVIYVISAPSEERATDSWREQFEAARMSDSCLLSIPQ